MQVFEYSGSESSDAVVAEIPINSMCKSMKQTQYSILVVYD